MAIFPYHAICFAALFCLRLYSRELWKSPSAVLSFFVQSIPEFLLIQKFGFPEVKVNVIEWYLSAMLIAMAVIYPMALKYYHSRKNTPFFRGGTPRFDHKSGIGAIAKPVGVAVESTSTTAMPAGAGSGSLFVRVIVPVIGLGILGGLSYTLGTFSDQDLWVGFVQAGVLRAIAEIAMGVSMYEWAGDLSAKPLSDQTKGILTGAELLGFAVTFYHMFFGRSGQSELTVLLCMMVSVTLVFSGQTLGNELFQKNWILRLGRLNLSFYLVQLLGLNIVRLWIKEPPIGIRWLLTVAISFVLAWVVQYFGDRIKTAICHS